MRHYVKFTVCLAALAFGAGSMLADETPASKTKGSRDVGGSKVEQKKAAKKEVPAPEPTLKEVSYGSHPKQVLTTGDEGIFHQRSFVEILHPLTNFIELLDFREEFFDKLTHPILVLL